MKRVIIILLIIIEITSTYLLYRSSLNKNIKLDDVILRENKINKKLFGVYVEGNSGYEAYNGNTWPSGYYALNEEKSGCINNDGELINNALSYSNGTLTITTGYTSYCYVYFDKLAAKHLSYSNERTECTTVQCAIEEISRKVMD